MSLLKEQILLLFLGVAVSFSGQAVDFSEADLPPSAYFCSGEQVANLLEVYRLARANAPQLRAQIAAVQAAMEAKPQAIALFLPVLGISADYDRILHRQITPLGGAAAAIRNFGGSFSFNTFGYTLSLTQPLYQRENFVRLKQAEASIAQTQANLVAEEQALLVRTAERYFDILAAQDVLTFAQAEKKAIARQLKQTRGRFEVGVDTIIDVNEAQAAFDLAASQVIVAENDLFNAQERLRAVIGQYVQELADLKKETPLLRPDPQSIDQWAETALLQNPQIDASEAAVALSRQQIALAKSGHYPSLDLVGANSINVTSGGSFPTRDQGSSIGLRFNLPLFQGGVVVSRTREARHELEQSLQLLEQARREVFRQTREAYLGVISGISQVKALQQAIISNESSLEATQSGFKVGTRTTVDVLDARRDLFGARRDYSQSRYEYILETLRLKQGAGIITLGDLAKINQWLDC